MEEHQFEIEASMFGRGDMQHIKQTWNHLEQSCWTDGKMLLRDSCDAKDVAHCVRQTIALPLWIAWTRGVTAH